MTTTTSSQRACVCVRLHQRLFLCIGFLIFSMKIMRNNVSKREIISGKHTDFFGEVQPLSGNNIY